MKNIINVRMLKQNNIIEYFLKIKSNFELNRDNISLDINNDIPSSKKLLYSSAEENAVKYLKQFYLNEKAALSEYGWIFLINDTNDFLSYMYGLKQWEVEDLNDTLKKFEIRNHFFQKINIKYIKFIIPEKAIIYSDYLPKILYPNKIDKKRPAILLDENIDNVYYLDKYLIDTRSYGMLYFRGDTHTNWLGSYYIYLYIIEKLKLLSVKTIPPNTIDNLTATIVKFKGDLYCQLNKDIKKSLDRDWSDFNLKDDLSYETKLKLSKQFKKSYKVEAEEIYVKYALNREVIIYENADKTLPTCLVFRDSTADFIHELLAEHFSRIVFIWLNGAIYEELIDYEKPDIVFHIMAERFVSGYPINKTPYVPINKD